MTTERRDRRGSTARLLAVVVLGCAGFGCFGTTRTRHGDRVDVSGYPAEVQSAYRVFALRCSRCHTLARPLNAHITEEQHWVRYVARMRRTPGSGISPRDAKVILRFLLFYTRVERGEGKEVPAAAPQPAPAPAPAHQPEPVDGVGGEEGAGP